MGDSTTAGENSHTTMAEEVCRVVDLARELQDSAASFIARTSREEEALRQQALSLDSNINKLKKCNLTEPKKLEEELYRASYILSEGDAAAFLPSKSHGVLLRMFLGPIDVRASRKEVKFKVKQEYNRFRNCAFISFFPITATRVKVVDLGWMLTCISGSALPGLALRGNILRVNGSDIRPWWIYHHYCAMTTALISLTWEIEGQPDCAQKQRGVKLFLQWAIMQGVAMLLQNRYQRQRLYTRIALGKARRMDVVWGETAGVDGQLLLLCPILFILQGFEGYVGMLLLKTALDGVVSEWQVVTCGILLITMAVGNFANTVQALLTKYRFKLKVKKSKSKQEVNQASHS
ncbi:uncharacterized protein LOC132271500 isoform X2 [Cornus florida]|uniref:uncharacterized protein LOC132271500 isoform X2 n=1 Tax=Cornus florida TaxID=4283 RepID=UPI0028A1EAE9|nr:uncharacterized protein LOC132271500 isoform X2 [Cornus florida]